MKIHYEWEAKDVKAGLTIQGPSGARMRIGYAVWAKDNKFVTIDPRDMAVFRKPVSRAEMARELTKYNYRPVEGTSETET